MHTSKHKQSKVRNAFIARLVVLAFIVAIVLLALYINRPPQSPQPRVDQLSSVAQPARTYKVVNKQIIVSQPQKPDAAFMPYGVQLEGILMAQPNWATDGALTHLTRSQVQAAHDFWHANTVSLQLSSKALLAQSPYDSSYLQQVDNVVIWTTELHMNIIIVLQYEGAGNSKQLMPTQDSIRFWNILAQRYANNRNVFFDLFNEPQPAVVLQHNSDDAATWNFWQHGGSVAGQQYVGMQQLVDTIRQHGFHNLLFIDGAAAGEDIQQLPQHTLTGSNLVYAIHPYPGKQQHGSPQAWGQWFGDATVKGNFPVVADEWSLYQDQYKFNASSDACFPDAASIAAQMLAYLHTRQIGLIGYALYPGTLIRGWNFTNPTSFSYTPESCPIISNADNDTDAQGVGTMLRQYFATYNTYNF